MARSTNFIAGRDKRADEIKTALGSLRRDIDSQTQPRLLTFFSVNTPTTNATGYLHPWFYAGNYETVVGRGIVLPFGGTAKHMYTRVRTVGSGTGSLRFVVRRNNADTSLVLSMKATARGANNRADSVVFEPGDLLSVSITDVGTVVSPADVHFSLEVY